MSKEVPATEEKQETPAVTDELLKELRANPAKMRELDTATRGAVLAKLQGEGEEEGEEGDEENDSDPGEEKPEEEGAKDEEAEEPEKSGEEAKEPEEKLDTSKLRDRIREEANEANRLEQKLKAMQARKDRAKAAYDKALAEGKPVPEDPFENDEAIKGALGELRQMRAEIAGMKALLESEGEESEGSIRAELDRKKESGVFAEFEDLQERYPDLKTKTPIAEINAQYAKALDSIVESEGFKAKHPDASAQELRQKAIEWYNAADEAARTALKVPFPEEMDKFAIALELWNLKVTNGGTLRGHYLQKLDDSGTLHETVQASRKDAAVDTARKVIKAVKEQETELKTIGPGDGHTDGFAKKSGQSVAQARDTIKRLNPKAGRWTAAEKAEHAEALRVLSEAAPE